MYLWIGSIFSTYTLGYEFNFDFNKNITHHKIYIWFWFFLYLIEKKNKQTKIGSLSHEGTSL